MYKLPVWGTVSTVYGFIWHERMAWFKFALAILAIVLIGFALMVLQVFGLSVISDDMEGSGLGIVLFVLIMLFFLAYAAVFLTFTVAWHRHYLLWPEPTSVRELFMWSRRHWVFLGRSLLIGLIGVISYLVIGGAVSAIAGPFIFQVFSADPQTLFSIGTFIGLWAIQLIILVLVLALLAGFLPSLPAAAIEDWMIGLGTAMSLSRGNRLRICGVLILGSVFPFHGIQGIISLVVLNSMFSGAEDQIRVAMEMAASPLLQIGLNFVSFFFSFLGIAIGISLLTACYQQLRDNIPLESEPPSA